MSPPHGERRPGKDGVETPARKSNRSVSPAGGDAAGVRALPGAVLDVPLTPDESEQLAALEAVVDDGLQTWIKVGTALQTIRDSRLYRQTHTTFEDYCRERFGMGKSQAYRLIDGAGTARVVSPIGDIANLGQARELAGLDPEQQREVWTKVTEVAEDTGTAITAATIQSTRKEVLGPRKSKKSAAAPKVVPTPRPKPRRHPLARTFEVRAKDVIFNTQGLVQLVEDNRWRENAAAFRHSMYGPLVEARDRIDRVLTALNDAAGDER